MIRNYFLMLEPRISGHLSYVASFPFSHKLQLKTGATVLNVYLGSQDTDIKLKKYNYGFFRSKGGGGERKINI